MRASRDPANSDEADARNLYPNSIAGCQQLERPAVPRAAASADEAVLHGIQPGALLSLAEGTIELAVPRLCRSILRSYCAHLSSNWIEQPRPTEKLLSVVTEHLEAQHVDRNIAPAQVGDDSLGAIVERRGNNDDLMALIQSFFIKLLAEPLTEVLDGPGFPAERSVCRFEQYPRAVATPPIRRSRETELRRRAVCARV